jgi:hypothetical protein
VVVSMVGCVLLLPLLSDRTPSLIVICDGHARMARPFRKSGFKI